MESSVETTEAPAWLQKLENRREKLSQAKLGHEAGAGSPCNECGDKCIGLDLHYWRKICRNCKCRKDQHICNEDDLSGWAQFEILGQTPSKPAVISIPSLNKQNVKLEWVPPNVSADVVSDYMDFLGTSKIPIAGSNAAAKRKQQLEFQVPPHDLDASLCDNLSASETQQMQQYIQKIREHCVGQGHVVRVGDLKSAQLGHASTRSNANSCSNQTIRHHPSIRELLNIKKNVSLDDQSNTMGREHFLSVPTMQKLGCLNEAQIYSLVKYGPFYERIISDLKMKNLEDDDQSIVLKTAHFLKEYQDNEPFRKEINDFLKLKFSSPPKSGVSADLSATPHPSASVSQAARSHDKSEANYFNDILHACGLPLNVDYKLDPVFHRIINSIALAQAIKESDQPIPPLKIALSLSLPKPYDLKAEGTVGEWAFQNLPFDLATLKSAIVHGTFYDQLFDSLEKKNIHVDQCKLLQPINHFRNEILTNKKFCEELMTLLSLTPFNMNIYYGQTINRHDNNAIVVSPEMAYSTNTITDLADKLQTMQAHDTPNQNKNVPPIRSKNAHDPECLTQQNSADMRSKIAANLTCQDCKASIGIGEVAVKAERAGQEMAWHPQCFKCNMCRELLADLVYFFHGGEVFCGRDLAVKLKMPRCKACDELIFTKEFTAAENATFHVKHFCCFQCDMPLAGKQYIPDEKSNMPICLKCFDTFYAASCQYCKAPIGPRDQGVSWCDLHWHSACFTCAGRNCGTSLIGQRFCVKESLPFCSPNCVHSIMN